MTSKYAPQQRAFYRRLARDEIGGGDSAVARRMLIEDGQDWIGRTKFDNARRNSAMAKLGRLPMMFAETTKTTINSKPTPNGAKAIARARKKTL